MPGWSISEDSWTFAFPWPVSFPRAKYDDPSEFPLLEVDEYMNVDERLNLQRVIILQTTLVDLVIAELDQIGEGSTVQML